jgi:hypothetical protein
MLLMSVNTVRSREVTDLHDLEASSTSIHSMRQHKIIATNIKTKDWRQMKVMILTLPDDMICKIDHFSNAKGKLKANFWMQKLKVKGSFKQVVTFVFWQVVIDQEACCLERQDSEDSDDAFEQAHKCMSGMNLDDDV